MRQINFLPLSTFHLSSLGLYSSKLWIQFWKIQVSLGKDETTVTFNHLGKQKNRYTMDIIILYPINVSVCVAPARVIIKSVTVIKQIVYLFVCIFNAVKRERTKEQNRTTCLRIKCFPFSALPYVISEQIY